MPTNPAATVAGRREAAASVVRAVREMFAGSDATGRQEWAVLEEFTGAPGPWDTGRRADLFCVRAWSGGRGHERVLVEVKVDRADLRAELADPSKLAAFARHAHRAFLAVPVGLVRPGDEVPDGVGVIEVAGGVARVSRRARAAAALEVPEVFFVEAARRAARAEARNQAAAVAADPAARIVQLEADLAAARGAAERARAAAARDADRLARWLRLVADAGGAPCECGAVVARSKTHRGPRLRHADGSDCPLNEFLGNASIDGASLGERLGQRS